MEIKDLEVKFGVIQKMAGALNKTKLVKNIKTVAIKRDDLIELFLKGVESVPPDKEVELPKEIATFYNDLVEKLEGTKEEFTKSEKTPEPAEEENPDECPVFKKGWKENNEECQTCLKDFPDDYKECMEVCLEPAKEKKEKKRVASKKESSIRYTRIDAFHDAVLSIKGNSSLESIAESANAFYIKNGGKNNMDMASRQTKEFSTIILTFGILIINPDSTYMLNKAMLGI